jgi:hypothetical protein
MSQSDSVQMFTISQPKDHHSYRLGPIPHIQPPSYLTSSSTSATTFARAWSDFLANASWYVIPNYHSYLYSSDIVLEGKLWILPRWSDTSYTTSSDSQADGSWYSSSTFVYTG